MITAGRTLFGATAAQDRALTATIDALPDFLRDTRSAVREIDGAARDAEPTLAALRPVVPLLSPALLEVDKLAPELRRTFTALDPVIAAGVDGLPALGRILTAAKPAIDVLDVAAEQLVPVADYLGLYRNDVIAWAARVGAATNARLPSDPTDARNTVLRVLAPITEEGLVGYERRLPSNRYNPYLAPGGLSKLLTGLESFDCRNTGNPQTVGVLGAGPPPCKVQDGVEFQGVKRSFPHVQAGAG
jgi:phospholipid/cholesterol/gamma-HCH transport system substrate-binding protein